ncbi:MAG TPA: phosphoribosyltransferase family protein [Bacteroidia bacterium]|nr:phosphoribosyltransferase family protein [Bacteroidia bacterium]
MRGEKSICFACLTGMPRTRDEMDPLDNPVARVFWGRVPVRASAACYVFVKGGKVQELIHNLKYNGRTDAGIAAGKIYGSELRHLTPFNTIDLVLPVPLHRDKLRKRGYNQAACFGEGLAKSMHVPILLHGMLRLTATASQTRKSRVERWENVEDVFVVNSDVDLRGKHILLVDDVITTGATIEACAQPLLQTEGVSLSIVSLASARD